jgi:hypothetical protein
MPAGDRTGPYGMGPRTGRGMGYCSGYGAPGWAQAGPERGFYGRFGGGRGSGGGRGGWRGRHWSDAGPAWGRPAVGPAPYGFPSREQEIDMLKEEAEWLKTQLESIHSRIDELSTE